MNIEEIKRKLEELGKRGGGEKGKKVWWRPTDEHVVRAVPIPGLDGEPVITRMQHKNVSQFAVDCTGEGCPICEFAEKLRAWRDEDGNDKPEEVRKKEFEIFRKIQANPRYFMAVVVRGTDIFTDPKMGVDLNVSFKKKGEKGNKTTYNNIDVEPRKVMTPLSDDPGEVKRLLASVQDLNACAPLPTNAELEIALKKWVGTASAEAPTGAVGKEYPKPTGDPTPAPENAEKPTGTKSVDDAFDQILAARTKK
jgi:hypothetical protein